jgi:hypothetical protein
MKRRADTVCGGRWVREDVPLPDAHDDPSSFSQISINSAVASLVGRELGDPPIAPIGAKRHVERFRSAFHQRPSVPEVAVDEHRDQAAWKCDIRSTENMSIATVSVPAS